MCVALSGNGCSSPRSSATQFYQCVQGFAVQTMVWLPAVGNLNVCTVCIESWLWVKHSLLHREWHSYQYCAKTFSPVLYLTATKQKCIKCHQTETQCTTNAWKFSRKDPQKKKLPNPPPHTQKKTRQSKQQNQVEKQGKRQERGTKWQPWDSRQERIIRHSCPPPPPPLGGSNKFSSIPFLTNNHTFSLQTIILFPYKQLYFSITMLVHNICSKPPPWFLKSNLLSWSWIVE